MIGSEEVERMINMIEKNGIISMYIHEKKSNRGIARILSISRNTVDKYVKEYKTCLFYLNFAYLRISFICNRST
jgi:predicted transcriptional regulator